MYEDECACAYGVDLETSTVQRLVPHPFCPEHAPAEFELLQATAEAGYEAGTGARWEHECDSDVRDRWHMWARCELETRRYTEVPVPESPDTESKTGE